MKEENMEESMHNAMGKILKIYGNSGRGPRRKGNAIDIEVKKIIEAFRVLLQKSRRSGLEVKAVFGSGNWKRMPGIVAFDRENGDSPRKGCLRGFGFREDLTGVYLLISHGINDVVAKKGNAAEKELKKHADRMRKRFRWDSLSKRGFHINGEVDLKPSPRRNTEAKRIAAGVVVHKLYERGCMPTNDEIDSDLVAILDITKRGTKQN